METHIEGIIFRYTYGGYIVRSIILKLQFMEIHRKRKLTHIERTVCGELYREYNIWSFIFRVQW